jgi:hypothetical protein
VQEGVPERDAGAPQLRLQLDLAGRVDACTFGAGGTKLVNATRPHMSLQEIPAHGRYLLPPWVPTSTRRAPGNLRRGVAEAEENG